MVACVAVTSLLAWHQGTPSGMGSGRVECRLVCCLLQPFGLSSLGAPCHGQLSRLSPAVPRVSARMPTCRAASSTSVLHRLCLLMGLVEDVRAQAHRRPGTSRAGPEETVLHAQICDRDPGRTERLQDQIPRLPLS